MARLVIRQLDDDVEEKLRRRARHHGRTIAGEVREILRDAVTSEGHRGTRRLGSRIAARFRGLGLTEEIPELRDQSLPPAMFGR